jgi:thiamine-monophosphate kinase
MSTSKELVRLARLKARLAHRERADSAVRVGIGDDAAVLDLLTASKGGALVWTVDVQVEGTHFKPSWASWADVGWRSFMAAASDLAAMGAEPVAALSALVLAPSVDDVALDAIAGGQAAAADEIGAPIVGGNLSRGTETSITTTLIGRCIHDPVLRSGAEAGDGLWLAGAVGLAGVGLSLVQQQLEDLRTQDDDSAACLLAWRRPIARIHEGRKMAGIAHAAIDVSDGLAHDAWQLAEASDVRIVLDVGAILAAGGEALIAGAAIADGDATSFALHGGEDYALLAASPTELTCFAQIGTVERLVSPGSRVLITSARGTMPLEPRGFDHFG